MKNRRMLLPALLSIALVSSLILSTWVAGASGTVHQPNDHFINHSAVDSWSLASAMALNTPQGNVTPMVAAGGGHIVGLKSDGTVVAVGNNFHRECNVGGWTDIVRVAAGWEHTVGLKSEGTVVAVGANSMGKCEVGGWTGIAAIAAGGVHTVGLRSDGTLVVVGASYDGRCNIGKWTGINQTAAGGYHTVGLKSDGTVIAVGDDGYGRCDVGGWTDIVQIAAGNYHTVGLKNDGTVVAVGHNSSGQCNVGNWTDIIQIAAGWGHTVAVKSDGTVVAMGDNSSGQCNVGNWTDITQVSAGNIHTVGLESDGTVVAAGGSFKIVPENDGTPIVVDHGQSDVGAWMDIVQVAAGDWHTVGLKSDGTVVAVGSDNEGQCDVGDWTSIVQAAASEGYTVGVKSDGTVVAAGWEAELAKWNLGVTAKYALTISSTAGGYVTSPGEGVFVHNAGVMVLVVAKPEKGYRFVNWTDDVGAIFNVNAATTVITMSGDYSITANFEEKPPINWPLIGGIMAAVLIVGLVIFFARRKGTA